MSGWYTPIRGKCTWWRESADEDDEYNANVKVANKKVKCVCGVEGQGWTFIRADVPPNCPEAFRCRYYIKQG